MTSLQQMLQNEAASESVPMAPVNRIVQTGQARVRRRRLAVVAVTVATVLALAAVAVPLVLTWDSDPDPVDSDRTTGAPTLEAAGVAWAHEGIVHFQGAQAELPPNISLLTSTASAAVMVTHDAETSTIFTLDDSGTVLEIGTGLGDSVAADPTGDRVAWVRNAGGARELVVYDTRTEQLVDTVELGDPASMENDDFVIAVEADRVTYATQGNVYRWEKGDDGDVELRELESSSARLIDVRAGVQALQLPGAGTTTFQRRVGQTPVPDGVTLVELSPDGAFAVGYEVSMGDTDLDEAAWEVSLLSTVDGSRVPLSGLPGRALMAGWTRTGDLTVLSYDTPFNELSADSAVSMWLCAPDGVCSEPSDAPDGTLGDTLAQVGRFGPLLLTGMPDTSGSSGSQTSTVTEEPTTGPSESDQP